MTHAYIVGTNTAQGTMRSFPEQIGHGSPPLIWTYMILGGEDAGISAVKTLDELGHAVPHRLNLLGARERLQHQVPWEQPRAHTRL